MEEAKQQRQQRQRKYPGLSQSEVLARNNSGRKKSKGAAWNRVCVICNSSKTLLQHRKGMLRQDGKEYSYYPVWYCSELVEGRFECNRCRGKSYYEKNKSWVKAQQKRWRLQRKKLMSKMLASMRKINKEKKNRRHFESYNFYQ